MHELVLCTFAFKRRAVQSGMHNNLRTAKMVFVLLWDWPLPRGAYAAGQKWISETAIVGPWGTREKRELTDHHNPFAPPVDHMAPGSLHRF